MVDINLNIPALEKLLEYSVSGIGAVSGPMLARWKARAEADALRIAAQGQADAIRLIIDARAEARQSFDVIPPSIQGELDIRGEIQSRISFQEEKRQKNIESVVTRSAAHLEDKQAQDHEVDHDWTARFFADAQDVSSEQMQDIWARILSGEVETPGRTSLHTLAILKNLSQLDAALFVRISRFVLDGFILNDNNATDGLVGFPEYDELFTLQGYGLLSLGIELQAIPPMNADGVAVIDDGDSLYRISRVTGDGTKKSGISIPAHALTSQGKELYRVVHHDKSSPYLGRLATYLRDKEHCILEHAEIIMRDRENISFGSWKLFDPHGPSEST